MTSSRMQRGRLARAAAAMLVTGAAATLLVAACSSTPGDTSTPATAPAVGPKPGGTTGTTAAVTRLLYGSGTIPGLEGRELDLLEVVVQPGAHLATHRHPGTQIARIEAGELTYTIVSGEASVARAGAERPTEKVGPSQVVLRAGDTVYENPDLVHFADNRGTVPVVIALASLFTTGEPLSIPVEG